MSKIYALTKSCFKHCDMNLLGGLSISIQSPDLEVPEEMSLMMTWSILVYSSLNSKYVICL